MKQFTNNPKTIRKQTNFFLLWALLIIITFTGFYACKKQIDEGSLDPKLTEFVRSSDFKSNNYLSSLEIDIDRSRVTYYNDDANKPELHLVLKEGKKIVAIIDAIKNTNTNILLPNDKKYFMLHRDLSNFDLENLEGEIKLIDLNYDSHIINELDYEKGVNKSATFNLIPQFVLNKYANIIEKNSKYLLEKNNSLILDQIDNIKTGKGKLSSAISSAKHVPCDYSGNGDLSFSECYRCFNSACQTNSDCYTLCYGIGDAIGWVASRPHIPYCQTSIGISCIWLSLEY